MAEALIDQAASIILFVMLFLEGFFLRNILDKWMMRIIMAFAAVGLIEEFLKILI